MSHGSHIISQNHQVFPSSDHAWQTKSLTWLPIQEGKKGIASDIYSRKTHNRTGCCTGKYLDSTLIHYTRSMKTTFYKTLKTLDRAQTSGLPSLDTPHVLTGSCSSPLESQICRACSTSIIHTLKNGGTPYIPPKAKSPPVLVKT